MFSCMDNGMSEDIQLLFTCQIMTANNDCNVCDQTNTHDVHTDTHTDTHIHSDARAQTRARPGSRPP